jgi:predicted dehydrogenase
MPDDATGICIPRARRSGPERRREGVFIPMHRIGVVGAGYFGKLHASKYAESKSGKLVAICDIDREKATACASQYGSTPYTDYTELFDKVDAVSIVVPTNAHFEIARDFLRRGIHVLLEKPISSTLEEADELIRVAKGKGVVFQVGHLERYNPAVQSLAKVLHRPRFIECQRISPFKQRGTDINVVLDLMIHDIDLVLDIVKSPVAQIDAIGVPVLSDAEDIANARIRFADGCVATITASRVSWKTERTMRIFQPDAYIVLDLHASKLAVMRRVGGSSDGPLPELKQEEQLFQPVDNLKREIESFLSCIKSGAEPLVTATDARRALEGALEISRQLQSWRETLKETPPPIAVVR